MVCETEDDARCLHHAVADLKELDLLHNPRNLRIDVVGTPRGDNGYTVIPYSHKINWALDQTQADLIVYLDNGSMPGPDKYRAMAVALEQNPGWGAVYCGQQRTGMNDNIYPALEVVDDAYCALNYTQVMHRKTGDRWPTDMTLADPDLADATFWRKLHASLGPFYPVDGLHDWHHIDGPKAQGL